MAGGYPLGAIVGGSVAAMLLRRHDWPIVFQFGAAVSLLFIPLVLWRAPESILFLAQRGGTTALVTLALLNAWVPPDEESMQRALASM